MTVTPRSWIPLDPDYSSRRGYDPGFLGRTVPAPALSKALIKTAKQPTPPPLPYQHFSVLLNPARRLAWWAAVNVDGAQERRLADRQQDLWWFDKRLASTTQVGDLFYTGSGFQRGHLVRRLDPAWGATDAEAARGEADSFHWTNCAPQVPVLNTQWWLAVEKHVLDTADTLDQKIVVFSGGVLSAKDPNFRDLQIPLAYWKVVAWVDGQTARLRSLGFLVKQDEVVAQLLKRPGARGANLAEVPAAIRAYQVPVSEISQLTGLLFGALAKANVDVFPKAPAPVPGGKGFAVNPRYRPLSAPGDLTTRVAVPAAAVV